MCSVFVLTSPAGHCHADHNGADAHAPAACVAHCRCCCPHSLVCTRQQALFVLYESASGFSLFDIKGLDEIGTAADRVQDSVVDLTRFGKVAKLAAFKPFASAADALEQINAISEAQLTDDLRNFLTMNLPKARRPSARVARLPLHPHLARSVARPSSRACCLYAPLKCSAWHKYSQWSIITSLLLWPRSPRMPRRPSSSSGWQSPSWVVLSRRRRRFLACAMSLWASCCVASVCISLASSS